MNMAMALVALATLGGFIGILVGFVPRADLIAVSAVCFALAAGDMISTLRHKR